MATSAEVKLDGEKVIFQITFDKDEVDYYANLVDISSDNVNMRRLFEILSTNIRKDINIEESFTEYLESESDEK